MRGEASVVEQVRSAAIRVAASFGLEIFDVQFRREAPGMILRVLIDFTHDLYANIPAMIG